MASFNFFTIFVQLTCFKKYLFGLAVVAYVITTIGIPVFLHYCGGELEAINYVLKADSCCGGEEDESESNDCCEDEGYVLKSAPDFTTKDLSFKLKKSFIALITVDLPFLVRTVFHYQEELLVLTDPDPPKLQSTLTALTVLRI